MQEHERSEPTRDRASFRAVLAWGALSAAGGLGFAVAFVLEANVAVLGLLLALAFGGLAAALRRLVLAHYPQVTGVEERPDLPSEGPAVDPGDVAIDPAVDEDTAAASRLRWGRRTILTAGGALAIGLLAPATSMGPTRPDVGLRTRWAEGTRLLDDDGRTLAPEALPEGGLDTVWPEGPDGGPLREELSAVVLIRAPEEDLGPPTDMDGVVDGNLVAYSKVCTHMGCPVGLFRAGTGVLFCPCHQASFDAGAGAVPTFGPAERALPQLPLRLEDGVLVAAGAFIGHVGPTTGLRPRQGRSTDRLLDEGGG
ncbi:Rieske (2Fe-2S) protein [Egibacter rhizosphaerae]|uniref:Cytochrome bc1 complex Rieske iron-sulfur subunit n=1 Tax=Egibacter rhizosphaerae TaxID=1670831 RepID=A0A411YAZ9_9ACTN|nr:Rieske (2Fe-2S) protein [Egibacter rhizosphaerae]QBI18390.1 Rieske (2Fe-2S) protein [Egibacter rhizosphaerae]